MPFYSPNTGVTVNILDIGWENFPTPASIGGAYSLTDVVYSPSLDLWAAVVNGAGAAGSAILTSPDALDGWTVRTTPAAWVAAGGGITWSPTLGLFAAVTVSIATGNQQIITSPDGITWTIRATGTSNVTYQRIIWAREIFVAVGSVNNTLGGLADLVMTSTDGITWTQRNAANDSQWFDVAYSPTLDRWVAVAQAGAGAQARIMTQDGAPVGSWILRSVTNVRRFAGVEWSPELGLFVIASDGNRNYVSADGITWTENVVSLDSSAAAWQGIAWSPTLNRFAMGASSGVADRLATGDTPLTTLSWETDLSDASKTYNGMAWSAAQGKFVVVGNLVASSAVAVSCARFTTS